MAWQHLTRRGSAIVSDSLQTIPANDDYPVGVRGMLCDLAAAFILLTRIPLDHCQVAHLSVELGHKRLADILGKTPILDLGMRLGEASGAAVALLILRAAVDVHNGMATFDQAGVSNRE